MATQQLFLVCDNSTLTNFKSWAQSISSWFSTCSWTQSSDTGQVNWSTIVSVPGASSFVYEIWQPADSLQNFYVKVEYGNGTTTNSPAIRLTISTTTNGSGTCTGFLVGPYYTAFNGNTTSPSSSTTYECDFSGDSGRMHVMMWRNAPATNNAQTLFSIERSVNSSGAYTSSHVTLVLIGGPANVGNYMPCAQQTLLFGVGAAPAQSIFQLNPYGGLACRLCNNANTTGFSSAFNGTIPIDTVAPVIGAWDYQLTGVGLAAYSDIVEGVTFTITLYGSTRTYMPGKTQAFEFSGPFGVKSAVCMRYD